MAFEIAVLRIPLLGVYGVDRQGRLEQELVHALIEVARDNRS